MKKIDFIPATMERKIAKDIVFRPMKSWHSMTYAGEKLTKMPNSEDRSGCMRDVNGMPMTSIPYTVTHRVYWHKKHPKENTISAFLSYPDAMGSSGGEYFWETLGTSKNRDIERFFGDDAEAKMEKKIIRVLSRMKP
jgi:hypothetical protein